MGLIRPELAQWLAPRREFFAALAGVVFSLWVATRGGWFFGGLGLILLALCFGWAVGSRRRLAFRRDIAAPGVLDIDEVEIRYIAARALGGSVALRDLTEIRLIRLNGHDTWRLKTRDGQALLIPVEARGADQQGATQSGALGKGDGIQVGQGFAAFGKAGDYRAASAWPV